MPKRCFPPVVGRLGKNRRQLNANVSSGIYDLVSLRAQSIDKSRSEYTGLILKWWEAQGSPPVHHLDRLVQVSHNRDKLLVAAEGHAKFGKK